MKEYPAFSVILFLYFIICFIIVPEWKNGKGFEKHLPKYVSCDKIISVVSRRVGMADDADSKSVAGNRVRVQVPLPASIRVRLTAHETKDPCRSDSVGSFASGLF